jgi:SNF2 family DNA or RNA helicase
MIPINPSRWKLRPYAHQVQGVKDLTAKPVLGLFWQMRCGKSKAVIDAACELHQAGELDVVVVVAPAQVIEVWADRDIGEVKTHCWVIHRLIRFNADWCERPLHPEGVMLHFILASLEYIRQEGDKACSYPKVDKLLQVVKDHMGWLVIDEGSALGSPTSAQTRAVLQLRKGFERITMLDGTPAGDSTKAVYSKFKVLDPNILGYKNQKQFLLKHAIYDRPGRYQRVVGYKNLELITEKTAPYVSRVEAKDVLDMPAKVNSFITVSLCPKTWDIYRRLRDDAIVQLDRADDQRDRPTVTVQHAPVMVLRLAQICAGFIGGLNAEGTNIKSEVEELSSEATDGLLSWLRLRLDEDASFKCVVWSRWRAEIERLNKLIIEKFETEHGTMWGDVKDENFLHPRYSACPTFRAGIMVCQPQAAQYGVSFARASTEVFLSQGYSLVTRQQSEDRIQAPETRSHSYLVDVVVTGPKGERTVTHDIRAVLLKKENVALRTIAGWKQVLEVE